MKSLRIFLAALVLYGTSGHLLAADAASPLYLVLFRLVGADGKLQDLQTVKVIDLLSGSNNAVAVELPRAFLDQARQKAAAGPLEKPAGNLASFLYVPDDGKHGPGGISFRLLDGIIGPVTNFRLLGHDAALCAFGTSFGHSALFVSYYALGSLPRMTGEQRRSLIEAEIQRSAANLENAEILSRKDLSTDAQTIVEVTCKSAANKALTLRARFLCNDRQTLGFTAITPDGLSAEDARSFDQLFDAFRFQ